MPVIAITGFAGEADQYVGEEIGLAGLVTKPFSSEALLRSVVSAWESSGRGERLPDDEALPAT